MKRIFIALKVEAGEDFKSMFSSLKTGLANEAIRWTALDNIHITLVFLGDTEETMIGKISAMLEERCRGVGPFELTISGLGLFKKSGDPRIIWTGMDPSPKLADLNSIIVDGLKQAGVKVDEHRFNPHLTLGRIKHISDFNALQAILNRYQNSEIQIVPVNEVTLFESILLKPGPVYKSLAIYKL